MFKDVRFECLKLKKTTVQERAIELSINAPGASVVAVGGFPVVAIENGKYIWCGHPATGKVIQSHITAGLGLSGMLTFMNISKLSVRQLGVICADKGHNWAYNWMTLTFMLNGYGKQVEYAFTRDTRFFMSWPVDTDMGITCTTNGTIKSWIKFIKNKDNSDFPEEVRKAMYDVHTLLEEILP